MNPLIKKDRAGFKLGYNSITKEGDSDLDTMIDFGIFKQSANEEHFETHSKESVWVLMSGSADIEFGNIKKSIERKSIFDEAPIAFHVCGDTAVKILAKSDCEWAVSRTSNNLQFEPMFFSSENLTPEFRGKGLVQDACLRNVRLIFDKTIRPKSNLVIGEVINLAGRWSSYPPHHHEQPEIYHYRFTEPQGYGHGELGEDVYKVKHFDTIKITGNVDHSQCAAPGYGMYYLWVVRHIDGNPYMGFEFTKDHEWTLNENIQGWSPKDFEGL